VLFVSGIQAVMCYIDYAQWDTNCLFLRTWHSLTTSCHRGQNSLCRGFVEWRCDERFICPLTATEACQCSELYRILYNNPVTVRIGAKAELPGRNLTLW